MELWEFVDFQKEYIGVVEPNFWGTHFTVFDHGLNDPYDIIASDKYDGDTKLSNLRLKLATRRPLIEVMFEPNLTGSCPRDITSKILNINERRAMMSKEDAEKSHKKGNPVMENIKPTWD